MPYSKETKEKVLTLYVDKHYSISEVVNQTAIPFVTVQRWLKAKGSTRTMAEARKIRATRKDISLGRGRLLPHIKRSYIQERLTLEAKVQLLERTLDSQQMIWWSEN